MRRSLLCARAPLLLVLSCAAPIAACSAFTPAVDDDDDDDDDGGEGEGEGGCEVDGDCRGGETCDQGLCRAICNDDRPCADGDLCVDGACRPPCEGDDDCEADQVCVDGSCVLDIDETICEPGEIGCIDDATAFVCSADGLERTEAPCRADQICQAGVCRTQVCEPSTSECSGNALVSCSADGTEQEVTDCNEGGACIGDAGFGCTCIDAACAPRACEPSSARCVGNSAQVCDAFGTGFSELVDCGGDSCFAGRCLADACTAGETLCAGNVLLTCDADGNGFDETACTEACTGPDGAAACSEFVCTPLAAECIDDDTLLQCDAAGSAEVEVPCGAGRFCANGVCQVQVCTPNARSCAGDSVRACDALGSEETITPCEADETCAGGECVPDSCTPQCGARTCGPDPACGVSCGPCAGTCSADGQCDLDDGPTLGVEVSWTPTSADVDLYVSRNVGAPMCDADSCFFSTCQLGDARPDWDGSGDISDGDPILDVVNVSTDNPERARVPLLGAAQTYKVGAHVFTGGTVTATIRVRLDGVLVTTHTRTVASDALWDGVAIQWDGADTLTSNDSGSATASFQCEPPAPPSCTVDEDCPTGFACERDFLGLSGSCVVGCRASDECTGGDVCNAAHDCVDPGTVNGWQEACGGDAECQAGFHCDFFTQVCEEECVVGCAPGTGGCCELSGGDQCIADPFIQLFGNCA